MNLPNLGKKPVFLKNDFVAGITVALILIPQSLAYAQLAGLPAQYGLYAALIPPVIAAFFGSSKQLATGPVAVLSLMTASSLTVFYTPGSPDYISAAILLALLLGIFQLGLGMIKFGGLISFLSHPVIYGFTNAAAIIIATTQLSKLFGVNVPSSEHHYETVIAVLQEASKSGELLTLLLGLWSIYALYTLKKLNKKLPIVLIVVISSTLLSQLMGYSGALIGEVPKGLPSFAIPVWNTKIIFGLIPTIITMGIIGFTEAVSIAQAISVKTKDSINPNKELIGQGLGNILGSFFFSYPTAGSFSRSAVNFQAGAKTALSSFFTSFTVLLTLLFFTDLLYFIPQVTLAGVIIYSVSGLIDLKKIRHIWNANPYDGIAAFITFFSTIYFAPHLDKGIMFGVIFSIGYYLYRSMHPRVVFLSKYKDGALHDATKFSMDRCENIAVVRLDAPLFFANAKFFEEEIVNDLASNKGIKDILIIGTGINQLDATGEEMLKSLFENLRPTKKTLYFSDLKAPILQLLKNTGLYNEIHPDHFFSKSDDAIRYVVNILEKAGLHTDTEKCPLKKYVKRHEAEEVSIGDKRETIAYFYHKLRLN